MRVFVFLLILGNLLFAAWTQGYLGTPESPDALRAQQQLNAERLTIVARDEPPPLRGERAEKAARAEKSAEKGSKGEETPEPAKPVELCLKVAGVPADPAQSFVEQLGEKLPAFRAQRSAQAGSSGFWVFIPPFATRREAESKAAELKKLGVPEFFVVQDGAQARAISLGVFSTREAASARLEQLRGKGVRSAKVGERPGKPALFDLTLTGPEGSGEALRRLLADRLSDYSVTSCTATP